MAQIPISALPPGGPVTGTELIPADQGGATVSIPSAALVGAAGVGLVPGLVLPFAGGTPPAGFLLCDGSAVSQATYPALYAVLGTLWGPDGGGDFTLPDFRDRCLIGTSPGGLGGDRPTARSAGQVGGEESHQLSIAELAAHSHNVTDPTHAHDFGTGGQSVQTGSTPARSVTSGIGGTVGVALLGWVGQTATQPASTGLSVDPAGSDMAHNTMQPFAVLLWIIKT